MRVAALVKRILIQIIRDKRTLALLFIAPLLVLTLMNFVFNGNEVTPQLGVNGVPLKLIEQLEEADIQVRPFDNVTDLTKLITDKELDGFLQIQNNNISLTLTNDEPSTAKSFCHIRDSSQQSRNLICSSV